MSTRLRAKPAKPFHRMQGIGVIKSLLLIPVALVLMLILAVAFYEGRKAYWDYRVREMCAKDGGTTVYEKVIVTRAQFQTWGGVKAVLGIPNESEARMDIPFFRRTKDVTLRTGNPALMRLETRFVRRADGKLLGKTIHYFRRGGDFPSWSHESSFGCPVPVLPIEKELFILEEESK